MKEIPVMRYPDDGDIIHVKEPAFTCARWWPNMGGEYSVDSCNGLSSTPADHHDQLFAMNIGSLFVKPGCTLYMYTGDHYSGESQVIQGPAEIFNNSWGVADIENGPWVGSSRCRCVQEPINCVPEDEYEVILVCDNLNGDATVKCSYAHTVGTKFSDEISEGGDIDMTIGVEMQAQMWGIFSATGSWSASTGYHWDHVSTETKSDQITITVEAEAPPGKRLIMEQAIGHCGGSQARTEMFRTSHEDFRGNIVFQNTEKIPMK